MQPVTLEWLANRYKSQRPLEPGSRRNIDVTVRVFCGFLNRTPTADDLNRDTLNRFVEWVSEGRKPETARGHRNRLLSIWRSAAEDGFVPDGADKVRRVRVPRANPDSWEPAEVAAMIEGAKKVPGTFSAPRAYGISRAGYLVSLLEMIYFAGMRLEDAMRIGPRNVRGTCVAWSQHKTGKPMVRPIPAELVDLLVATFPRGTTVYFGGRLSYNRLRLYFIRICKDAGLDGTLRKLRRTSGNMVEMQCPGAGHLHLGNTRSVFEIYYADKVLLGTRVPSPPSLSSLPSSAPPACP